MNKKMPKIFSKKNIIIASVAFLLASGFLLPLFLPDKASEYSGLKKEAAIAAITHVNKTRSGIDAISSLGSIKSYVADVAIDQAESITAETLCNTTFYNINEPNSPDRYVVTIRDMTIFGLDMGKSLSVAVCRVK